MGPFLKELASTNIVQSHNYSTEGIDPSHVLKPQQAITNSDIADERWTEKKESFPTNVLMQGSSNLLKILDVFQVILSDQTVGP